MPRKPQSSESRLPGPALIGVPMLLAAGVLLHGWLRARQCQWLLEHGEPGFGVVVGSERAVVEGVSTRRDPVSGGTTQQPTTNLQTTLRLRMEVGSGPPVYFTQKLRGAHVGVPEGTRLPIRIHPTDPAASLPVHILKEGQAISMGTKLLALLLFLTGLGIAKGLYGDELMGR